MAESSRVDRRIGITATVPVEVLLAAGRAPVDLNNIFITGDAAGDIRAAESAGFPVNCCAWIKGVYGAARRLGICEVIGVSQGDCANTHALLEIWASEGVRVHDFEYPWPPSSERLAAQLDGLAATLGTTHEAAENERRRLARVRGLLHEIDELTWRTGQVSGEENHLWLIGASDFGGDPDAYARQTETFLSEARGRPEREIGIRLAFLGIPPICEGLYAFLQASGAGVVFNEFQRQFAMTDAAGGLVEQYMAYTYPYGVAGRIADISRAVAERRIDGAIHYVQSFCFRHIQDRLLRKALDVPVLTLEYDRPGPLDGRSRTRLEAFLELLAERRGPVAESR